MAIVRIPTLDSRGNGESGVLPVEAYVDTSSGQILNRVRQGDSENGFTYAFQPTGQTWEFANKAGSNGQMIYGSQGYAAPTFQDQGDGSWNSLGSGGDTASGMHQIGDNEQLNQFLINHGVTPQYDPNYGNVISGKDWSQWGPEYRKSIYTGGDPMSDFLGSYGPLLVAGFGAGTVMGAGGGLGAAGEVASAPPSSYWSMLADSSGAGVPSAAAGTVGGASDLTVQQLAQIYQSSGMSAADAMAAAQQAASAGGLTGSAAGAYTGIASQVNPSIIQQLLNTPTPPTSLPGGSNSPAQLPATTPPSGQPLPPVTTGTTGAAAGGVASNAAIGRIIDGTATAADYAQVGIPVGSQILSGLMGSSAAGRAADAQLAASQAAIAENARQYNQTRTDNLPYLQTGQAGTARLRQLLGLDPQYTASDSGSLVRPFAASDLNADPVYQSGLDFGLKTGTGAINARALANGSYDSGATLKELTRYGNDYGSTKANDSYNRYNTNNTNTYNRLAGVSGAGQTAANTVSAAGQNQANNNTNLITGAGNANAASIVGGAQAWGGALSGIGNAVTQDANNARLLALLKQSNPSQYGY